MKVIGYSDKVMVFSFYALIYFLPISIALVEIFTVLALLAYFVKRGTVYSIELNKKTGLSFIDKFKLFLVSFKPVESRLNGPLGIWLGVSVFSTLFSLWPHLSLSGFLGKILQNVFLYFNFVEAINSKKRLRIFLTIYVISFTLIAINGFFQFFTHQGFILGHVFDGRIASSLRHSNDYGAYLLIAAPIWLGLSVLSQREKGQYWASGVWKILFFILFVIAIVSLGLTMSRGAWVGFLCSFFILGIYFFKRNKKVMVAAVILMTGFILIFYPKLMGHRQNMHSLKMSMRINNRSGFYVRAGEIFRDYPVFGSGINTYSAVQKFYEKGWGGYPHNCYLQMLVETGFVGLSAFLWVLFRLFQGAFQDYKKMTSHNDRMFLLGTAIGLIGFLVHSFFDTSFYSVQLGSLLWLVMGVVTVIPKVTNHSK